MKKINKLLLFLFLVLPLTGIAQSQILNGININAPNGFYKTGNLEWKKGNDIVGVASIPGKYSDTDFIASCKNASRSSEYLDSGPIEFANGNTYTVCFQFGENDLVMGSTLVFKNNHTYIIQTGTYPGDYEEPNRINKSTEKLIYLLSYMTYRIENSFGQTDEEYFKRANAKDAAGDYSGALEDYNKAIEINPNNARIYSNRGLTKNSLKDYSGAIEDFNKSIEINPTNSYPYYNTGIAKYNLQDYSGALESYNKAIDLDPNYTDAYFNRSLTKAYLGNFIGSLMDSDYTIKLNPNYAQAYVNRGVAKLNTNDKQGACQDARKAQSLGYDASQLIKLTCN